MTEQLSDISAERAVLAGIVAYGMAGYDEIADIINSQTFTDELHQIIFNCIEYLVKHYNNITIDVASILATGNTLGYGNVLSQPDERRLIRGIFNFPIHKDNIRKMAMVVKKLEIGRKLAGTLDNAKKNIFQITGYESIDQILAMAENPIFDLTTLLGEQNEGPQLIGDKIDEYIEYLISHPITQVGLSTGCSNYDKSIGGGLRRKTVNLIGARPKVGKTSFGDNVAVYVAGTLNIPVLNLDTEMSYEDHRVRILANIAEVAIDDIETGNFGSNTWKKEKVRKAMDKLRHMPYHYESVAGKSFDEILGIMRRWVHRTVGTEMSGATKPCLIIYDYLKLMAAEGLSKNIQEYQLLGFQIASLHDFMVRYDVPCLSFIQLNRDGITREDTDVASGSDRQIWLCSNFSILKKKSDEEMAEDPGGNLKLVNLVARHGGGLEDGDYINIQFKRQYNRMVEGKTRNQAKEAKSQQSEGFIVNDSKPNEQISL